MVIHYFRVKMTDVSVINKFIQFSLKDSLIKYGLGQSEVTVYLKLSTQNPLTISEITKISNIPRTTVVENLNKLSEKGLVVVLISNGTKKYLAESAAKLKKLILEKKVDLEVELSNLKSLEADLPNIVKSMVAVKSQNSDSNLSIKFYSGKKNILHLYEETMLSNEVYSFCDLERYYEAFPNTRNLYEKAFKNNPERRVYDILIENDVAKDIIQNSDKNYITKFLPAESHLRDFIFGDYMIFDNKVMLVQLNPKKLSAILIESKDIALSFKALHKTMWELL